MFFWLCLINSFTKGRHKLYRLYPSCFSLFPSTRLFKFFRGILTSKYDLQGLANDLKRTTSRYRRQFGWDTWSNASWPMAPLSISSSDKSLESRRISNDNLECKWPAPISQSFHDDSYCPGTVVANICRDSQKVRSKFDRYSCGLLSQVGNLRPAIEIVPFLSRVKSQPRRTGTISIEWMWTWGSFGTPFKSAT